MLFLLQHLKAQLRSRGTLLGILLGLPLGVLLGLPYSIGKITALAWYVIPDNIVQLLTSGSSTFISSTTSSNLSEPGWVVWVLWGVVLYYAIFPLCAGRNAYLTTQHTHCIDSGLVSASWITLITVASAILPSLLTLVMGSSALPVLSCTIEVD